MRLAETIGRWLGRVEIVLAGQDERFRDGEEALARGDAMRARAAAHAVLSRVPGSPLGLALLADACEAGGLDAEAHLTLEDLAKRAPSQAEVWLRLARARARTGASDDEVRDADVRALAVAEGGSEERRDALLALADMDLAAGDGARAELWLARAAGDASQAVTLRRAEARLAQGDGKGALALLGTFEAEPTDGRAALALGRARAMAGDAAAFAPLLRAYVLDTPGASELLSSTVAWVKADPETLARVQVVVAARGEGDLARWRAAFARASGAREEARKALLDAVRGGDTSAARPLLDAALEDADEATMAAALGALEGVHEAEVEDARRLPPATDDPSAVGAGLDALQQIASPRVLPIAETRRDALLRVWLPAGGRARWDDLLGRLDAHARALHDLEAIAQVAAVSAERARPVRVAIVGEFNAGKSTFINALVGAEVAPTGVLPTTATLHHLRYGPDPIARIALEPAEGSPPERIVPAADLRATLKTMDTSTVRRVEILLPIASLTRVEILDTPGFNAPDTRHTEAARSAFEEADAAIWLLDANQPLKQTERTILEEAKASGLPVQMLVNKADRLKPEDLQRVMELVSRSVEEVGLRSHAPPIALSARQALAGKLGDAEALAASGWGAVQMLLDEEVVGKSDELKERALRRRAAKVAGRLSQRAREAAREEEQQAAREDERRRAMVVAAARLDGDPAAAEASVAERLAPHAQLLQRDLADVVSGRDASGGGADAVLSRYRVDRALARLGVPLAGAMADLARGEQAPAPESERDPADRWRHLARAVVRAAVLASPEEVPTGALATSAVACLVEELAAQGAVAPAAPRVSGAAAELEAIARLLQVT